MKYKLDEDSLEQVIKVYKEIDDVTDSINSVYGDNWRELGKLGSVWRDLYEIIEYHVGEDNVDNAVKDVLDKRETFQADEGVKTLDVNNLSEKEIIELKKKINSREQQIAENKRVKEREISIKVLEKISESGLIDFLEHSRTSCSDGNPANGYYERDGYARCTKCHLLEIIEDHKNGINDFKVKIDIDITRL